MKRFIAISLVCLALLGGLYAYHWALLRIYWHQISSEKAPDGSITAYELLSGNDGYGEAPYGHHIVLSSSIWPMAKYSEPRIFAGYCGPLTYSWVNSRKLLVKCTLGPKSRVAKQVETYRGITIEYEISRSTSGVP